MENELTTTISVNTDSSLFCFLFWNNSHLLKRVTLSPLIWLSFSSPYMTADRSSHSTKGWATD